jgi:hypothetical protein
MYVIVHWVYNAIDRTLKVNGSPWFSLSNTCALTE